jgi:hypothetical protein
MQNLLLILLSSLTVLSAGASMSKDTIRILGVHRYPATEELIRQTIVDQWGEGLTGAKLKEVEKQTREGLANLYLIEVWIEGPVDNFDWSQITQEIAGEPRENWQVPYDEQQLDDSGHRWAFFFHFLDLQKPLLTKGGPIKLPTPKELPAHLKSIKYDAP